MILQLCDIYKAQDLQLITNNINWRGRKTRCTSLSGCYILKGYMRGESGTECLLVCLSEYLPLRSVYILLITVKGFVSGRDHKLP